MTVLLEQDLNQSLRSIKKSALINISNFGWGSRRVTSEAGATGSKERDLQIWRLHSSRWQVQLISWASLNVARAPKIIHTSNAWSRTIHRQLQSMLHTLYQCYTTQCECRKCKKDRPDRVIASQINPTFQLHQLIRVIIPAQSTVDGDFTRILHLSTTHSIVRISLRTSTFNCRLLSFVLPASHCRILYRRLSNY